VLVLSGLALWLSAFAACPARADESIRIVILDADERALSERVRAELGAADFAAETVAKPATSDPALALTESARQHQARLAITFRFSADGSQLLIYDSASGEISGHELAVGLETNQATLAIRVVEILRARVLSTAATLAPIPVDEHEPHDLATPVAAAPSPALDPAIAVKSSLQSPSEREQPGRVRPPKDTGRYALVNLGLAVLGSPGGLGPSLALSVSLGGFITRSLRLVAFALVPLTAMEHSALEGASKTRVTPVGIDLGSEFFRSSPLRTSLAGGLDVAVLTVEGRGEAPYYTDLSTRRASFGVYMRGGLSYHFSRLLALRGDLTLGSQISTFAIEYAGRKAAHWGLPWLAALVALEVRFP
jgi:hypothetical protein